MKLYIANKNYSSWSLRPWMAMTMAGIGFDEELVRFDLVPGNRHFNEFSPTGKVPVLVDGDLVVWESLAILEFLADRFPETGLWPDDRQARARARACAAEMHGGFAALRSECPMNIRRVPAPVSVSTAVDRDVTRIEAIWRRCLDESSGPFLFGRFSNADAMFAPVVNRLEVYCLSQDPAVAAYSATVKATPAWLAWERAARAEPWTVAEDEV